MSNRSVRQTMPTRPARKILTVNEFIRGQDDHGEIVHLKGFGSGLTAPQWKEHALKAIGASCHTVAFDGDPIQTDGFTALVPEFLRRNPANRAVAFRDARKLKSFQNSWWAEMQEFGDRLVLVSVDLEKDLGSAGLQAQDAQLQGMPDMARDFFWLGRIAIKATNSKAVVAAGGGGIAALEAKAGIAEGASWTVLALSRGRRERNETLVDWAQANRNAKAVRLIQCIDEPASTKSSHTSKISTPVEDAWDS
jgi:hypothetical protein